MRAIMASSADGFLCRGPDDDMAWASGLDKQVFRLLTGVGGVCAVGRVTRQVMPTYLKGRSLWTLSRNSLTGCTLNEMSLLRPDAWLLGGPTIMHEALLKSMVSEFHLVRLDHVELGSGVSKCRVTSLLPREPVMRTRLVHRSESVTVGVYRLVA